MHIPIPRASSSPSPLDLLHLTAAAPLAPPAGGLLLLTVDNPTTREGPTVPAPTRRHRDSISFFLPIFILSIVLIILILSLVFARCLYRRFKSMHLSPSPSTSSWKAYSSTTYGSNAHTHAHHNGDNSESELEEDEHTEQERLLARRRSTSYYDANRSRAPVAVVIQHDAKGRPISTWSTASSVAAQRGEELSRWSRRRDDLIKIYGQQSQLNNTNSFAEGAEEDDEEEERGYSGYSRHSDQQGLLAVEGEGQGHQHRRISGGEGPLDGISELGESHTHSHYNYNHADTQTHTQSQNPLQHQQETGTTQSSQRSSRVTTTSTLHEQQQLGGTL
ncbi:MAG: hypothetical protein J3R72DRAFT_222771 [Linnemannia gamsii]|nr:MAG: hypothetical protein J3R72DRAFT_222771 [Linnemannia gamsii]